MADEEDQRPSASLFENPSVQVCFNDGGRLFVPGSLFHDYPVLRPAGEWPRRDVELDDLTRDVGHVLFYYLLTGSYECVKPKGVSRQERLVNELTTGVGVHNASRKYNLPTLPEKAKAEVERLAKVLPFPQVLNLLRNLQLSPGVKEAWLDELVQNGLKNIFKNPAAYLEDTATQVDSDGIMFSNLILKNLATLLVNGVVPGRADDAAAISTPPPEPAEIEEEFLPKGPSSAPSENEPEAVPESQITDQPLVSEPELEAESEPVPDTEDPHTEQAKLESVPEIEHTEQEVAPESSEAKAEAATEAPTGEAKAGEVSEPAQEANATTESEEAVESPAASPAAVSPTEGGIFPATGKMVKKKRRSLFSFDSASSTKEEPVTAADSTTPEPVLNRTQSGLRRIRYLGR